MKQTKFGSEYKLSFRKVDIDDKDLLQQFRCEYRAIRHFIQNESLESKKDVSYILLDEESNCIIGFCAICCSGISVSDEDYNGNPYITSIPTIEIDYFAIDEDYRSVKLNETSKKYETLSQAFLMHALEEIKNISVMHVGATHVCLYSVPKAKNFYARCGFVEFNDYMHPDELPFLENCIPMYLVIDKE